MVEVNEKARRAAFITAIASLFSAIAATMPEVSSKGPITAALFFGLILSALIYKMGIRIVEPHVEVQENTKQYYVLLLLSALVVFWIIAVYVFVHPGSIEMSGGYGFDARDGI